MDRFPWCLYRRFALFLLPIFVLITFSFIKYVPNIYSTVGMLGARRSQKQYSPDQNQNENFTEFTEFIQQFFNDISENKNMTESFDIPLHVISTIPSRIIYNRVGKCGSRTVLKVLKDLSLRNDYNYYSSQIYNRSSLDQQEQIELAENLHKMEAPFIFNRQLYFMDFSQFGLKSTSYISVIRDPLSRLISAYYYRRFGDSKNIKKKRSRKRKEIKQMSFDECVLTNRTECSQANSFIIIPYFCGQHPDCKKPSQWALERAQKNVVDKFLFVGTLERLEETFTLLENLLPYMFSGASASYHEILKTEITKITATKFKASPISHVQTIMRERLKLEYMFYNFVNKLFQEKLEVISKRVEI